ncbi:unnamed protein product, partial [Rotaria sp. Silwood1]
MPSKMAWTCVAWVTHLARYNTHW